MQQTYVGRWHSDDGCQTAIVTHGRTRLHLVTIGYPISTHHLDLKDERFIRPLDYPLARAARSILKMRKTNGITKSAKKILKEALA